MKKIIDFFDSVLLIKCFFLWITLFAGYMVLIEISFYYILFPVIIYVVILRLSLTPPNEEIVKNVFGENPRIQLRDSISLNYSELNTRFSIAHNAAVLDFDNDNTNADSVKLCSQYGCKSIYLDIVATADNVLLVHRKSKLNQEHDDCDLPIEDYNHEELFLEFKNRLNLSTLEEILPVLDDSKLKVILNINHSFYHKNSSSVVQAILSTFKNNPFLYDRTIICCTNPIVLYMIRKSDPTIVVAFRWTEFSKQSIISISWIKKICCQNSVKNIILGYIDSCSWWFLEHFFYRVIGFSIIILPKEIITPRMIENWEQKNVRCIVGVVNLSSEKSYYAQALGVSYLTETIINDGS